MNVSIQSDGDLAGCLTALTRDLMLIPSTESRPQEVKRCFELVRNHLDALSGVVAHTYERHGHESMVWLPTNVVSPEVLLCGHLDVIDHPQADVYHSQVKDGRIVGPGAGDMKGQDAILIELFRTVHGQFPGISVGLALTSDEEIGGADGMQFLCEEMGLRCGTAIIPDGGSLTEITVEEKGVIHAVVASRGHTAHGARPWLGVNAAELLVERLMVLSNHFSHYRPSDARENHWYPTCSVNVLRTPNTTPNRIPAAAEATVDIRFPPPHSVESMRAEIAAQLGPEIEITPLMLAEPTHLQPDPLFCETTSQVAGSAAKLVKASGGSDGRFLRAYGIPVNLSRPLVGNLHGVDEWIDIASMVTYFRICHRYLCNKLRTA